MPETFEKVPETFTLISLISFLILLFLVGCGDWFVENCTNAAENNGTWFGTGALSETDSIISFELKIDIQPCGEGCCGDRGSIKIILEDGTNIEDSFPEFYHLYILDEEEIAAIVSTSSEFINLERPIVIIELDEIVYNYPNSKNTIEIRIIEERDDLISYYTPSTYETIIELEKID